MSIGRLNEYVDPPQASTAVVDFLRAAALKMNALAGGRLAAVDATSTAMPTAGTFAKGDIVRNSAPSLSASAVVLGWLRLVSGSAHVAGTDWAALVVPAESMLPLAGGTVTGNLTISGNVGITAAPGAWAAAARAIEFSFPTLGQDSNGAAFVTFNARENTAGTWKFKSTDEASRLLLSNSGGLEFSSSASGTSGNDITFSTHTTIDNSGNLIQRVNGTAPSLGANGTMTFELTSNTELKIKVRGSDGTTRSVSLTLA